MSANDEIAVYLQELLEHERDCTVESCSRCRSARNIYKAVRNVVFSGKVYPHVTIASQHHSTEDTCQAAPTVVSAPTAA